MLLAFGFEEIIPTSVKQASFGTMVGLIVRPGKSEGEIGEKGGNRLGRFFFTRPLFAGLPFNNVFSLGFLHGSATVAMRNNERGGKICQRLNEGCIRLFHLPGFLCFFLSIISNIQASGFMLLVFSNIQSMFQIGFVWQPMWTQSNRTAVIQNLTRQLPRNILFCSCCQ